MEPAEVLESAIRLASSEGFDYSHEYWELIRTLHGTANQHVFELAAACCTAPTAMERAVGADVLAQLGLPTEWGRAGTRPFSRETAPILRALLDDENEHVLTSAIHALGHHNVATADDLRDLARNQSVEVRHAVAFALNPDEPASQAVLLQLMNDAHADVRDWATFAIGSQTETDTPEIRQALTQRLTDADDETRGEAMVGLARRGDLSVVDAIVAAFDGDPGSLVFDAAEALLELHPDETRLNAALEKWRAGH